MKKSLILLFVVTSFISSCKKDDSKITPVEPATLQHIWNYTSVVMTEDGNTVTEQIQPGKTWEFKSNQVCKSSLDSIPKCYSASFPNPTTVIINNGTSSDNFTVEKLDDHNLWLKKTVADYSEVKKFIR